MPPRSALLLLRVPTPPVRWPSHIDRSSPLVRALGREMKEDGVGVNVVWDGVGEEGFPTLRAAGEGVGETYPARLYRPDGSSFGYTLSTADSGPGSGSGSGSDSGSELGLRAGDDLSASSIDDSIASALLIPQLSQIRADLVRPLNQPRSLAVEGTSPTGQYEVLVCTHGARDCRCAEHGGALVEALKSEVRRRGLEGRVKVGEVAHVGGHKYAANALLLPSLDLLGNLRPASAAALLSFVLRGRPAGDPMWAHWRGRFGLREKEQEGVWNMTAAAHAEEREAEAAPAAAAMGTGKAKAKVKVIPGPKADGEGERGQEAGAGEGAGARVRGKEKETLGREVEVRFRTFDGDLRGVAGRIGENLLEVGKRAGLGALEGVCGGNLECATCHVYLAASAPVLSPSEEELDMLGYAIGYRDGQSRLGCQVRVTEELAGWMGREGGEIRLPRY